MDSLRKTYAPRDGDTKLCLGCATEIVRPLHWSPSVWRRTGYCSVSCAKSHTQKSDPQERFQAHLDTTPETGCWHGTGLLNAGGYGQIRINGKVWLAHRLSLELAGRPVPDGLFACHHCDNRRCVNPDHLYAGTQADNVADAVSRGRNERGSRHHNAKLTDEIVSEARRLGLSGAEISRRFGVSSATGRKAARGASWRHVE